MAKKKQEFSTLKSIYLIIIVMLPIYAGFAVQFVPREHQGDPSGAQGWPFMVCDKIDEASDIGLLLVNASIIFFGIYLLVIASAILRYHLMGQDAAGNKLKKPKTKTASKRKK